MELDDMAQPLTDAQQVAFDEANAIAADGTKALLSGNAYRAALTYHRAASVPNLSTRGQVALLAVAAELLIELYHSLRLSQPTVH